MGKAHCTHTRHKFEHQEIIDVFGDDTCASKRVLVLTGDKLPHVFEPAHLVVTAYGYWVRHDLTSATFFPIGRVERIEIRDI